MKKYLGIGSLVFILLTMTVCAFATVDPLNQVINGDFANGTWASWEFGAGLGLTWPGHDSSVYCKDPASYPEGLFLRQVMDVQDGNPLWDDSMNMSRINVMADIRCLWEPDGNPGRPTSMIGFTLDWWSDEGKPDWWEPERYINQGGPHSSMVYEPGDFHSETRWYQFIEAENGDWVAYNPFVGFEIPDQPSWVSLEIQIYQANGEIVYVDNIGLESKCIPEPMSMVLGFMGLGSVVGLRRFVKK